MGFPLFVGGQARVEGERRPHAGSKPLARNTPIEAGVERKSMSACASAARPDALKMAAVVTETLCSGSVSGPTSYMPDTAMSSGIC